MFQAIVHAPELRPSARLCFSDLAQTPTRPPSRLTSGAGVKLRFGVCCPSHGLGDIIDIGARTAVLQCAGVRWRLSRCREGGGIDVPGLVAEDWIVVERDGP